MKKISKFKVQILNNEVHKDNLVLYNEKTGRPTFFETLYVNAMIKHNVEYLRAEHGERSINVRSEKELRGFMLENNTAECQLYIVKEQ